MTGSGTIRRPIERGWGWGSWLPFVLEPLQATPIEVVMNVRPSSSLRSKPPLSAPVGRVWPLHVYTRPGINGSKAIDATLAWSEASKP